MGPHDGDGDGKEEADGLLIVADSITANHMTTGIITASELSFISR